jgi:hypothetical protein
VVTATVTSISSSLLLLMIMMIIVGTVAGRHRYDSSDNSASEPCHCTLTTVTSPFGNTPLTEARHGPGNAPPRWVGLGLTCLAVYGVVRAIGWVIGDFAA